MGRPPFEEDDLVALVHAHLARTPEPASAVDPRVPPCVSAVVARLLEKDPARRYQIKRGVELVRSFEGPGMVRARHDELNQVWTNLLHNALQAMQYAGRLELRLAPADADHVRVQVIDSGPGIPEDILGRIFEPFYTTKAQGEGSGLGLSISRGIVERHGGTIHVDTRPGRTVFTVTLPVESKVSEHTGA